MCDLQTNILSHSSCTWPINLTSLAQSPMFILHARLCGMERVALAYISADTWHAVHSVKAAFFVCMRVCTHVWNTPGPMQTVCLCKWAINSFVIASGEFRSALLFCWSIRSPSMPIMTSAFPLVVRKTCISPALWGPDVPQCAAVKDWKRGPHISCHYRGSLLAAHNTPPIGTECGPECCSEKKHDF